MSASSSKSRISQEFNDPLGRYRRFQDLHAEGRECIFYGGDNGRNGRNGARLAGPLYAERIEWAGRLLVNDLDPRDIGRQRQQIFTKVRRQRLCLIIIEHALE